MFLKHTVDIETLTRIKKINYDECAIILYMYAMHYSSIQ